MKDIETILDTGLSKLEAKYLEIEVEIQELEGKLEALNRLKREFRQANEKGNFYGLPGLPALTREETEAFGEISCQGAMDDVVYPPMYPSEPRRNRGAPWE